MDNFIASRDVCTRTNILIGPEKARNFAQKHYYYFLNSLTRLEIKYSDPHNSKCILENLCSGILHPESSREPWVPRNIEATMHKNISVAKDYMSITVLYKYQRAITNVFGSHSQ